MSGLRVRIACVLLLSIVFVSSVFAPIAIADEEPNDTALQAEEIYGGDQVAGTLSSNNDYDDFYEVYLYEGDELTVILTGNVGDFDLYLYDEDGYELTSSMNDDSNEQIIYVATSDGWYFIDCWAYDGNGQYSLEVEVFSEGLLSQTWFWLLVIIVIIVLVVIIVAAKVASKPKPGDEMFGASTTPPLPAAPVQMPSDHEQAHQEKPEQVHCENCQKLIPADSSICPYCGTNPFERTF